MGTMLDLSRFQSHPIHATSAVTSNAFQRKKLAAVVGVLLLGFSGTVSAQVYDIVVDTNQTNTVTLTKPGYSVLISDGVSIDTGSNIAIKGGANNDWQITNRGHISGWYGYQTDYPAGKTVFDNAAGAQIDAGYAGISQFQNTLSVTNAGQMKGGTYGIQASASTNPDMIGLSLTNSGLIQGGRTGVYISQDYSMTSTVINLAGGTIQGGTDGYGIDALRNIIQIDNRAGAVITGNKAGVNGSDLTTQIDLTNAGTVTGINGPGVRSYGGGTVTNLSGGQISGLGGVVVVRPVWNDTAVVDNAGTIQGTGATFVDGNVTATGSGVGVYFGGSRSGSGAQVLNRAGGVISGTKYGVYSGYTYSASDVGPISIDNAGMIRGEVGIAASYNNATIVNRGEITGIGGTAIQFDQTGNFINTLTLDSGSVINGNVLAGSGNQNTLILQGQGSELLDKFIGFNTLTMQGDEWTLSGNGQFTQQADVLSGTLRLNNSTLTTPQLSVDAGAVLAGVGQINGNLTNGGTLSLGNTNSFGTLTVNGNYASNGGLLLMKTQLSGDGSPSDKLVVTGDTVGTTDVRISNAGGNGGLTGNGIELVHVGGNSDGVFNQQGRVIVAGYEYTLYKGSLSDPNDGNWYLRSVALPTPDPGPTPGPAPQPTPDPVQQWTSPLVGAYLGNQTAAVNMFSMSLHDRLGEPQFTQNLDGRRPAPSAWIRVVGNQEKSKAAGQTLDLDTDNTIVQLGSDVALWSNNGNNRWHLGWMAGSGHSKTDASNPKDYGKDNLRNAKGTVDGYSIGAYATWFGNASQASGPYVDTWLQYGWYDNDVSASSEKTDSYKSRNLSASVEAGYAFKLSDNGSRQWLIEPQAQVIFNSYDADDHYTAYGDKVHDSDTDGVTTRVGARVYSRVVVGNGIQPFIEANWLHGDADNSLQLSNGGYSNRFSQDIPKDRYELKAGVQAALTKNLHGWASFGWQTGDNSYQRLEGLAGVKYVW